MFEKVLEWTEKNLNFTQRLVISVSLIVTLTLSLISDEGIRVVASVLWCLCVIVMTIVITYVTAFKQEE